MTHITCSPHCPPFHTVSFNFAIPVHHCPYYPYLFSRETSHSCRFIPSKDFTSPLYSLNSRRMEPRASSHKGLRNTILPADRQKIGEFLFLYCWVQEHFSHHQCRLNLVKDWIVLDCSRSKIGLCNIWCWDNLRFIGMEESESAEVTTNLLISPCRREHDIEGVAESVTYRSQNYIAFVEVEKKFGCFCSLLYVHFNYRSHTITAWSSVRRCK